MNFGEFGKRVMAFGWLAAEQLYYSTWKFTAGQNIVDENAFMNTIISHL